MDVRTEIVDIIRDTREYLLFLKETGVDEIISSHSSNPPYPNPPYPNPPYPNPPYPNPPSPPFSKGGDRKIRLDHLREKMGDCRRCKLWNGRTNIVFGAGNPDARLLFVGEGPGEEEDLQAKPFVGKAGQLLTKMIESMGLARGDVYIANVVKCRPPKNRNPEEDEIAACRPFLEEQMDIIGPAVICALGTFAAHTLLETRSRISQLRGKVYEKRGYRIVPTFHPAYLLRNPQDKRLAWEDVKLIMKELELGGK